MRLKQNIPNFFTFLNLALGFLSIAFSINGDYLGASILLLVALLADGLDGYLARKLKTDSSFGVEIDSLADIVSFGVGPAVLMHTFHGEWMVTIAALIFLLGGAFRLARYNVTKGEVEGYQGMPITVNGFIFPVLYLLNTNATTVSAAFIIVFVLMISRFKVKKVF